MGALAWPVGQTGVGYSSLETGIHGHCSTVRGAVHAARRAALRGDSDTARAIRNVIAYRIWDHPRPTR